MHPRVVIFHIFLLFFFNIGLSFKFNNKWEIIILEDIYFFLIQFLFSLLKK